MHEAGDVRLPLTKHAKPGSLMFMFFVKSRWIKQRVFF